MTPFHITCTTCNARLTVRNREAIGQILACPKCQSMVLVEAPEGQEQAAPSPPPGNAATSGSAGKSRPASFSAADTVEGGYDSPDDLVGPLSDSSAPFEARHADSEDGDPDAVHDSARESHDSHESHESWDEGDNPVSPEAELAPTSDWSSQEAKQMRQWLLTGAAAVAGVVLAISVFGFLIARRQSNRPVAEAGPGNEQVDAQSDVAQADDSDPETGTSDSNTGSEKPASSGDEDGSSSGTSNTAPEVPSDDDPSGEQPVIELTESTDPPSVDPQNPGNPDPGNPDAENPPDSSAVENPEDRDPENDSAAPPFVAEAPETGNPLDLQDTLPTAESLRAFEDLLGNGSTNSAPPSTGTSTPPAVIEVPVTSSDVIQELPRPKPRVISVERQLELPLVEIEFKETPLRDFVYFVSDFSLLPITLDADALTAARIDLASPVTVKLSDTTVRGLLEAVAAPHGMAVMPTEQGVRLTFPNKIQTQRYDVSDLADAAAQRQVLEQHIRELLSPAQWQSLGGPWELKGGEGWIEIAAPAATQFEVVQILERLRAARGLPLQSGLPEVNFQPGTKFSKSTEGLSRQVTLNFVQERPLVEIAGHLTRQTSLQIIIDWEATMGIGWNPDTEAQVVTVDKPLSSALNKLLEPMQLSYRVVNDHLLQISTPEALRSRFELESYRVPKQVTGDTVVEAVYALFGKEWFREGGGEGTIRYDAAAELLLVKLPPPQQIALERLLRQWN